MTGRNGWVALGLGAGLALAGCSDDAGTGGASEGCEISLNQAELDTGFETCSDGSKRRRAAIECPEEETSPVSPCMPAFGPPDCASDDECTDQPMGYCADAHALTHYCGCYYGCRSDSDCDAGSICECGVVVGQCVPATCTTNDDCDDGFGCVATVDGSTGTQCSTGSASSYGCQTAADECHGDGDCPSIGSNPGACFLDGDHRACGTLCAMTP